MGITQKRNAMKLNSTRMLVISFLGVLLFIAMIASVNCNYFGIRDLRGNEAVVTALFLGLGGAFFVVMFLISYFGGPGISFGKYGSAWIFPLFLFVYIVTINHLSSQYCH